LRVLEFYLSDTPQKLSSSIESDSPLVGKRVLDSCVLEIVRQGSSRFTTRGLFLEFCSILSRSIEILRVLEIYLEQSRLFLESSRDLSRSIEILKVLEIDRDLDRLEGRVYSPLGGKRKFLQVLKTSSKA
jgi:hypothetical protein